MKEPFIVIQTTDNWEEIKKKKKEKKKGWKNSHCLSDYYMDLLNILLWLYVQVLCNLFKGKQIDNLKA